MKNIKLISIVFILTGLFACEPPVTFNEPQPTDTDNLSKFPKSIQGQYLSLADSSTISISDNLIQRIYDFYYKIHIDQLDSTSSFSGDTLIDLRTHEKNIVMHDGDSLIIYVHCIDTLFQMDYDNVVRKFKGYYFLNDRYDKTSWEVKKMRLTKGQLVISSISTKLEIEKLKEITESPQDTIPPYKFVATKKQFKKFVKSEGFSENEIFIITK